MQPIAPNRQRPESRLGRTPRIGGFTLLELMITVAVAAILLTLAAPSFQRVMSNTTQKNAHNDLLATLRYARTEAISRATEIAVTASSSGNWKDGWKVAPAASASNILREHGPMDTQYEIASSSSTLGANPVSITFEPQGGVDGDICFTFSDTRLTDVDERYLQVLESGAVHPAPDCI